MPRGIQTLSQDGINWIWFIEVDWQGHGRGEVTILRHWREHKGESTTKASGPFQIIEDMKRTVCAVEINGMAVAVKNREFIFSYPK